MESNIKDRVVAVARNFPGLHMASFVEEVRWTTQPKPDTHQVYETIWCAINDGILIFTPDRRLVLGRTQ